MSAAVPPAPDAARLRREMIAERQRRSTVWRVIHILGSLKFAVILLAAIAVACAAATFTESGFNTRIAQAYIYKSPWFFFGLVLLCINLFAVTLTRWPWQQKHVGFVITHYGIITLLAGAMIGLHTGFEGNVTLQKGAPPVNRVTTSQSVIWMEGPSQDGVYIMPFDGETARLSPDRPRMFQVPGTGLKVVADDFSPNMVREEKLVAAPEGAGGVGVQLHFASRMMGQSLEMPLVLLADQADERDFFGLARVSLVPTLAGTATEIPRETQMVFAKFAPVVTGPISTGIGVRLSTDGKTVTVVAPDGTGATYAREEVVGQTFHEAGALVSVERYWPDFAMQNGQPTTRSDQPNNPALLVRIAKGAETADTKPLFKAAIEDGVLKYQLSRGGQVYASGQAARGETIPLRWADWQAQVEEILPRAQVASEVKPGPELVKGVQGIPGIRAHLLNADGSRGADVWIESGEVATLTAGASAVRFGYGLRPQTLPFTLQLVNFEVPRDEGTDTPADFRATIEFRDLTTGTTKTGVARMNYPASFPGTLWANLTGINYKFSQAQWNPRDLDETTLQVLYDPGWLLKWIGSLAICIGIGIMFYWKPKKASS